MSIRKKNLFEDSGKIGKHPWNSIRFHKDKGSGSYFDGYIHSESGSVRIYSEVSKDNPSDLNTNFYFFYKKKFYSRCWQHTKPYTEMGLVRMAHKFAIETDKNIFISITKKRIANLFELMALDIKANTLAKKAENEEIIKKAIDSPLPHYFEKNEKWPKRLRTFFCKKKK